MNQDLLTIELTCLLNNEHGVILMNWALMALHCDHIDVALEKGRAALKIADNTQTRLALALMLATAGHPDQALEHYQKILEKEPSHGMAAPNACFVQTLMTATPKELRAQRQIWYDANAYKGERRSHVNTKDPERPIRIGYVSGDFKTHSAAMIFKPAVMHRSDGIEAFYYSTLDVQDSDANTLEFKGRAGYNWRNITPLSDEKAEALIREDRIDILVDLAGHTNGGRLGLFTRKPAPIQVTAWGFAHGTGCPEIDYFFADPIAIPEHERQHYVERIYDLPCIVSYDPPKYDIKGTSQLPYWKNEYITFGTYARYEKMNDECLKMFATILRKVPGSKLQFKDHGCRRPYSIKRIRSLMTDIAKDRLLFSIATSHPEHMQSYQQADLILDPWPHSGGVVCLEQLFMGVPMITRYGTQAAGRTSSSVLTAMGKKDWIAHSQEEYVEKAVMMVADPQRLGSIRKTLQQEFLESPVVKGYAAHVEAAYREIWRRWCEPSRPAV